MNDERLQEIEDRLTDATPGPWEYDEDRHTHDSPVYVKGSRPQYDYFGPAWGGVVAWWGQANGFGLVAQTVSSLQTLQPTYVISLMRSAG